MNPEIVNMLLWAAIGLAFYFLIIRPQFSKAKAQEAFKDTIKEGERVVTTGGVYGRIISTDEYTAILNIAKGTNIKVDKSAISLELTNALNERKSNS